MFSVLFEVFSPVMALATEQKNGQNSIIKNPALRDYSQVADMINTDSKSDLLSPETD